MFGDFYDKKKYEYKVNNSKTQVKHSRNENKPRSSIIATLEKL